MLFVNKFVTEFTACTKTDSTDQELGRDSLMQSKSVLILGTRKRELNALRVLHYSASLIVVVCSMVIHMILLN